MPVQNAPPWHPFQPPEDCTVIRHCETGLSIPDKLRTIVFCGIVFVVFLIAISVFGFGITMGFFTMIGLGQPEMATRAGQLTLLLAVLLSARITFAAGRAELARLRIRSD